MRRKDKQIIDQGRIEAILKKGRVLHIALIDGDRPYLLPVNYGYRDGVIYIHSAREGKKIDLIRKNNLVCFQVEIGVRVVNAAVASKCGTLYKSVLGYGRASFVAEPGEKKAALEVLMDQYQPGPGGRRAFGRCLEEVCIIRIDIDSMEGKESLARHLD